MMITIKGKQPQLHDTSFCAYNCDIIGDVILEKHTSVFFHSVIRGDQAKIHIEEGSNIQDNCTIHSDLGHPVHIGKLVSVAHNVILHGCSIGDESLIGMGAILLNGSSIGEHCLIGAGSLVPEGMHIPAYSVAFGSPIQIRKQISQKQMEDIKANAYHYQTLANTYKEESS